MNKILMITLFVFIGLISSIAIVTSATVTPTPQPITPPEFDSNQIVLNKIDTDGKETRQYFSTELQRQNAYFIAEFTKRADYYEKSYQDLLNNAVLKLGTMWAGIFIVAVSVSSLLNFWAEKRRYKYLLKSLKLDVVRQIKSEYVMIPDKEIRILNDYLVETKQMQKGEPKPSLLKRIFGKKEKKVMVQKEESKLVTEPQHAPQTNNQVMEDLITKMKRKDVL